MSESMVQPREQWRRQGKAVRFWNVEVEASQDK